MTRVVVDTSVWSRQRQTAVRAELRGAIEAGDVALIAPLVLELLTAARNAEEYDELAAEYDALELIELSAPVARRARSVQAALAHRGYHRGPSPTDLLAAAAAETADAELWHCDRHFELIGAVTGQPMRRVGT